MAHRIEVSFAEGTRDVLGERLARRIEMDLGLSVKVRIVEVYTVDAHIDGHFIALLKEAFSDPVTQRALCDEPTFLDFDYAIEVGFRPGVTDNVGRTAKEVIEALKGAPLGPGEAVYTSRMYLVSGDLTKEDVERIVGGVLANTLIHRYSIKDRETYIRDGGMGIYVPKVSLRQEEEVEVIDFGKDLEELMKMSNERTWAFSKEEILAIKAFFSRDEVRGQRLSLGLPEHPTDVEIECIAQTWSEHCKHKIFHAIIEYEEDGRVSIIDGLFKTFIVETTERMRKRLGRKDFCLSVFSDNAGVIRLGRRHSLAFKVETHNTPSALDPYGGALTGIVGVNRDPLGTGRGSKPIFNTDVFCFAPPDYSGRIPPRLFHPKRVLEGVREGVEHGGNKSGIPTVNGSIVFDEAFLGKPLVFCGTGGIMPRSIRGVPTHKKAARKGDLIVMVGGRVGKDGIHGATFSSLELSEASPTSAVQIGDPITQKRMTDFLLLSRDEGLFNAITDCGAGGLSSACGEMARDTNGAILYLERAPLKYEGLRPWEILLSEAQERMVVSVSPEKIGRFLDLAKRLGVECSTIGEFRDTGAFHITYKGKTVGFLPMDFLHDGLPRMRLRAVWRRRDPKASLFEEPRDYVDTLLRVLKRWNVCSKEYIVRQYDHEVQGGSVVKPLVGKDCDGPSDGAVLRPDLSSFEGIAISHGICPKLSRFDTYLMVALAIDEAIRNNLAVGGTLRRMAILDNFCWPDPVKSERNPDGEFKLAQLVRANKALAEYASFFGTPIISGKDSMKNDYIYGDLKISILPTVLISAISYMRDVRRAVTMDCKEAGDVIIVMGVTFAELGGSEYLSELGVEGHIPPFVRKDLARRIYRALERVMAAGIIRSCHDLSDGGLACGLAESSFSGALGAEIDLSFCPRMGVYRDDFVLFSESAARFVVTVRAEDLDRAGRLLRGVPFGILGRVRADNRFIVRGLFGKTIIETDTQTLKAAWQEPFKRYFF